jgi:ribose-phosphate pyrophosphokinase
VNVMMVVEMALPQFNMAGCYQTESCVKLFTGRANPELAHQVAEYLGIQVSPMVSKNFSDGESYVQIQESVRGDHVFVVQPTCHNVNENLMELLLILDALKRASAAEITAVIPYYGYARQDRKNSGREPISAKLVADLISTAGATRVLAMDLHTGQLQGFFNILTDHLQAAPVLLHYIEKKQLADPIIVSPDAGGVERARRFAKRINAPIAIVDKRRSAHNVSEVFHLIGSVKGKNAVLIDDMIDTAGTIVAAAEMLLNEGAASVDVLATHPVFSGPAVERLANSGIREVIVTDSIPLKEEAKAVSKIVQVSIAPLLGEAIARIQGAQSVSEMFL